jgi:hypothetical protein
MDAVSAPDVKAHVPRKMKKEKIQRATPRLYQHVRAELMKPPQSFLEDEEDKDEEEDADAEDNTSSIDPTARAPGKRRLISTNAGPHARPYARRNSIWSGAPHIYSLHKMKRNSSAISEVPLKSGLKSVLNLKLPPSPHL